MCIDMVVYIYILIHCHVLWREDAFSLRRALDFEGKCEIKNGSQEGHRSRLWKKA